MLFYAKSNIFLDINDENVYLNYFEEVINGT